MSLYALHLVRGCRASKNSLGTDRIWSAGGDQSDWTFSVGVDGINNSMGDLWTLMLRKRLTW